MPSAIEGSLVLVLPSRDYVAYVWYVLLYQIFAAVALLVLGALMAYQPIARSQGESFYECIRRSTRYFTLFTLVAFACFVAVYQAFTTNHTIAVDSLCKIATQASTLPQPCVA